MNVHSKARVARGRRAEARELFKNAILSAAETVFARKGFQSARIQDIAQEAGTGVGTVYNHFDSKEDLLSALFDERTSELLAQLKDRPARHAKEYRERLETRIQRLLVYVEEHRCFFALVLTYGLAGPVTEFSKLGVSGRRRMQQVRDAWIALVKEGISLGALERLEPAHMAAFLGGTVRAFTSAALHDDEVQLADKAPVIVRLFLHGTGAK